jgi:hypothetical protein
MVLRYRLYSARNEAAGKCKDRHTYILERIHDRRLSDMDAIVLVGIGLTPSIQHDDGHRLPLGELGVVRQRPLES